MNQKQDKDTKIGSGMMLGIAICIILMVVCMVLDIRVGIVPLVGILACIVFIPYLKELLWEHPQPTQEQNRFLDTAVLQ